MIDRLINRFNIILFQLKTKIPFEIEKFFKSKIKVSLLFTFIILILSLFIGNNLYEYYVKNKYINIFQVRSSIVSFIRKNFSKAIEIGIVDFSSIQGIVFEDIKISQEEDFSSNRLLFTSKRIDIRLPSIFAQEMRPQKIVIYGAKVDIDINDPLSNDILKYFKELKLPDIYFENLEVTLRANNQNLLVTTKPIHISIKTLDQITQIEFNDKTFLGLIPGSLSGSSNLNLETNENSLKIDFKDHELENMSGISKILLNLQPDSGLADGFININKTSEDFKIEGNLNFQKFSGDFFPISNIKANDFTINAKFSYLKEFTDVKTSESYFKRKISSPEFFYDEQIYTPVTNLKKTTISIQVDNFNNLINRLTLVDEFSISGTMKLNMRLEETGKNNDWIWIDGSGSLSNLSFTSESPLIRINDSNFHFTWNQNEIQADLSGKLFDKVFNSDLKGSIAFNKPGKENLLTINSNLDFNMNLKQVVLKNFQSIYESFSQKISKDIKERQEKMLPESFFIQSFLFKVFLEKAKNKGKINIDNVIYRFDSHSLGKYGIDFKVDSGVTNLSIAGGQFSKAENEMNLNFYFDRKVPSLDLKTRISSLFWFDETFDLCDSSIYTDLIDFNMAFISSGNNFSDMLVNRSINGELSLRGNSLVRSNPGDTVNLSEIFLGQNNLGIKLGFNAYSQEGFLRNIEIKGSEGIIRGNANLIRSEVKYGFYGQLKDKPINLTFVKTGASCQSSKK